MTQVVLPRLEDGRRWMVQTSLEPIYLTGTYDPRQQWLSFVEHVYFQIDTEKPKKRRDLLAAHNSSLAKLKQGAGRKYAINTEDDRYLYLWTRDFEQRMIPFEKFRMISNSHWARLKKAGYPGWDKTIDGEPVVVEVDTPNTRGYYSTQKRMDMQTWCEDNTRGCFHILTGASGVAFERQEDAMLFKLTYC